ncbi:MAG: hypothetical protein KC478_09880, partial [Bacteriovoracaceae bacterium]|nr:hypothetical protein [Bacteriovoracaceae bacterium]
KKRDKTFRPLYLKIAPELAKSDLEDLVDIAQEFNFSGIIATNTSVSHNRGPGGLSGELIKEQARQARLGVLDITKTLDDFSVIGAGGISNFNDALEFWQAGGDMVQIYTSFIYQGPQILKDFKNGIDDLLKKTGASSLQQWKDSL